MSVDVARWYVELERCRPRRTPPPPPGVTYMPDDFANAKTTAIAVSGRNGYPNSGTSTVSVEATSKPSQLRVTVTSKIRNAFGAAFGRSSPRWSRSAVADFNGPAPMGSPCNTYGNEPTALNSALRNTGDANRGPRTSVIVAPAGGASCTSNPQFWGAIAGPNTRQGQSGDAFMTRTCSSGNSGCTGTDEQRVQPTRLLLHRPGGPGRRRPAHDDPDLRPGLRRGRRPVRGRARAAPRSPTA